MNLDSPAPVSHHNSYESLSDYQRACLPATNFFRKLAGIPMIEVPATDEHYWKYFDQRIQPLNQTRVELRVSLTSKTESHV